MNKRVIQIRKANRLSQTEFAQRLGFTQSNLSLIELGKVPLTEPNIRLLCLTFGVREAWLRDGTGEMMDEEALLSERAQRLLELFRRLSPRAQQMIIEYAEKLLADERAIRGEPPEASKQAPGGMTSPLEAPQKAEREATGISPVHDKNRG